MKVIDLLQRIANGEIPKKIKYLETIYEYGNYKSDSGYVDKTQYPYKWFEKEIDCDVISDLNDEVEIIEEDMKIEKVNTYVLCDYDFKNKDDDNNLIATNILDKALEEYSHKINEIIDYLEENK